jgi:hypothetical protein
MYGLGFVIIGIAHEYRYIHWTMVCALIATPAVLMRVIFNREVSAAYRLGPLAAIAAVMLFREIMVRFALQ